MSFYYVKYLHFNPKYKFIDWSVVPFFNLDSAKDDFYSVANHLDKRHEIVLLFENDKLLQTIGNDNIYNYLSNCNFDLKEFVENVYDNLLE